MVIWTATCILGYLVIYGLNLPEVYNGIPLTKEVNYIYGGFHRLAWGVALGWVVFACCRGYGGETTFSFHIFLRLVNDF